MSRGRKRIFIFILVVFISLIIVGSIVFVFRIENIEIQGNNKYSDDEMIEYIFKNDMDKNPFAFYLKTKFGKQEVIPFVDEYDVEIKSLNSVKITIYEKKIIGYVQYKGINMYFDKDGTIVESSQEKIENVPRITGLKFDYIILDELLPVENKQVFNQILNITQALSKYSVGVDKLFISDKKEVTLYMQEVVVELGNDIDMNEKIRNLADMLPNLQGLSGTLHMQNYNESGNGYTFKKN